MSGQRCVRNRTLFHNRSQYFIAILACFGMFCDFINISDNFAIFWLFLSWYSVKHGMKYTSCMAILVTSRNYRLLQAMSSSIALVVYWPSSQSSFECSSWIDVKWSFFTDMLRFKPVSVPVNLLPPFHIQS